MYMEEKVESVRERISVNVTRARSGADAFSISFKGSEPETVMKIANTLAAYFIDENLKVREAQAIGTSSFLDDELEMMRKKLVSVEEALRAYRRENMGELPEQLDANLRILDRLQLELADKQEGLRDEKNRLADLENMIQMNLEAKKNTPLPENQFGKVPTEPISEEAPISKLDALKKQLSLAKMRYTSRHPDIIKLKRIIATMEAEETHQKKPEEPAAKIETLDNTSNGDKTEPEPKVDFRLVAQRNSIAREIGSLDREIKEIQDKIAAYNKRVENTPKREQELLSLDRDYENIQSQYSSMLSRKLEAEIAVNMERKQKGEQFRVIDPARLPRKPAEPDMKKLFLMAIAAGLGLGAGIVFLIDFFDTAFKNPTDVETMLGVPVLAVVPNIQQTAHRKKWKLRLLLNLVSMSVTAALVAIFAVLAFHGVDETTALVKRYVSF